MTPSTGCFGVDDDYDEESASDGVSRYGHYLASGFASWADWGSAVDDGRINTAHSDWLIWCWERASGPVMSPAYVVLPGAVLSARLGIDEWDGALMATVEVAAGLPARIGGRWSGWTTSPSGRHRRPERLPMALSVVTLAAQLEGAWDGPSIPAEPGVRLTRAAQGAVRATAERLNTTFLPAINELAGR